MKQGDRVEVSGELRRAESGGGYRSWQRAPLKRMDNKAEKVQTITRQGVYLGWVMLAEGVYDSGVRTGAPWDLGDILPPTLEADNYVRAAVVMPIYPGGRYRKPIYCALDQIQPIKYNGDPDDLQLFAVLQEEEIR